MSCWGFHTSKWCEHMSYWLQSSWSLPLPELSKHLIVHKWNDKWFSASTLRFQICLITIGTLGRKHKELTHSTTYQYFLFTSYSYPFLEIGTRKGIIPHNRKELNQESKVSGKTESGAKVVTGWGRANKCHTWGRVEGGTDRCSGRASRRDDYVVS